MALEALEMSEESIQTIATKDESGSDCAKEFDGSALECLEANSIIGDIDPRDSKLVCSTYSFKDDCADWLLLSLHHQKLIRVLDAPQYEGIWRNDLLNYCSYHRMLDHPTTSFQILKDKLQIFVNNGVHRLCPDQHS